MNFLALAFTTSALAQPPSGLVIVDAAADVDFAPLSNGEALDAFQLPASWSLRTESNSLPAPVCFELDGVQIRCEQVPPFAVAGDVSGDYAPFDPGPGLHTLEVYADGALVISTTFSVIETCSPGQDGADGADGLNCWDVNPNGVCDPIEDVDGDGICDAMDCQGVGPTYDGTDFALSNQSCVAGDVVAGIDANGNVVCASNPDTDTTYISGFGLDLVSTTFEIDVDEVVTRQFGALEWSGTEARASFGQTSASGAITVTVVNRNENEQMYVYRCMKVNLSVVACLDVLSGVGTDHLTFANAEKTMYSTVGFDLLTDLDGGSPFGAEVVLRNTSGDSLFYELSGGR